MSILFKLRTYIKRKALKDIKLIVLDLDGVLTDGSLYYSSEGLSFKAFNSKDGLGIRMLQGLDIKIAVISGGKHNGALSRCNDLEIDYMFFQVTNKERQICELQSNLKISPLQTAYIGDDLNDIVVKPFVNLFLCPADAHHQVKKEADIVLIHKGGRGCVRDLADLIIKLRMKSLGDIRVMDRIKNTLVA